MDLFQYWVAFLNRKYKDHSMTDYQIAQLTKVLSEMFSKGTGKPVTDYLVQFRTREELLEEQEERNLKFFNSLKNLPGAIVSTND